MYICSGFAIKWRVLKRWNINAVVSCANVSGNFYGQEIYECKNFADTVYIFCNICIFGHKVGGEL